MTGKETLPVYTSLVPGSRLDIQRAAIQSWHHAGFQVTTFNSHREANAVIGDFPEVFCQTALRDGQMATGKPVIFINDIIHHIRDAESDTSGIINSDIIVTPNSTIVELVESLPDDTLLACPRTEVDQPDQQHGFLDPFGYDGFFFHPCLTEDWNETHFYLGMPFWDHWLPMMSLLSGRRVLKLISNDLRHVRHPISRDDSFFMFNGHFAEIMISQMPNNSIGFGDRFDYSSFQSLWTAALSKPDIHFNLPQASPILEDLARFLDSLTKYVIHFIDERSEKIKI